MRPIRNNRGAVPTWVKILLAVLAVGFLGFVAICYIGFNAVKDMMAMDPAKVAAMSKDVAVISDPLPGNFKWKMGMNMKVVEILSAEAADGQVMMLITVPTAEKDAETMMHESTAGSKYGNQGAKMVSVDEKGTETVGGLSMPWELGTVEAKDGKQSKGFIGAVVIKPKSKTVMVIGVQPKGTYNLPETKQFLKGIQSF